ncbi:MAG: aminoacyl-tRNA hydrolase [Oscillospiraceae bacterium]|nr:aminoacyl-tRNA hydrolase [Oscillospiraceae bacterium]
MLKLFSKKAAVPTGPVEYLIVGLGNPGKEYENTRHNAGYMAVERIAQDLGVKIDRIKYKSLCADAMIGGKRVLLMKPSTFMNLSGQAVTEAARFYKIPMEKVIVFMDDISLEPGKVRIRRKGTDGGHNGIKNIIYLSGSDNFPRVKIGVGKKPHPDYVLADWVLSRFKTEEMKELEKVLEKAPDMAKLLVDGRMDEAMNRYNGK